MQTLDRILSSDSSLINQLFSGYLSISEQIEGVRFEFQKNPNGSFSYFKKSIITEIDRTISSVYEEPISFIESLDESIIKKIPKNYRFILTYLYDKNPVNACYENLPRNKMILNVIQVKDLGSRTKNIISDSKSLEKWSTILNVSGPPVLYEGTLSKFQINKIKSLLEDSYKISSSQFLRTISHKIKPFLNSSLDNFQSSVIISSNIHKTRLKITGGHVHQTNSRKMSDMSSILISDIIEFINTRGISQYLLNEGTLEERYIQLICKVYNDYIESNEKRIYGLDLNLPEFSKRDQFKVNTTFIRNVNTKKFITARNELHDLFRLMLSIFRSKRKKVSNDITNSMLLEINTIVDMIYKHISKKSSIINNSTILDFDQFKKIQ